MRSLAASAVIVRLASCGPSPSCRSRLSLRRSSSRAHQPLARALKIGEEAFGLVAQKGGVRRNADLVGEILEDSVLLGREALFPSAQSQNQLSHRFSPVDERQAERLAYRVPGGRSGLNAPIALQLDLRVRQLQRFLQGPGDGGQHIVGGERGLEALSQTRKNRIRVVPLAVHQAIHRTLQPFLQRLEEHGDEARSKDRNQEVTLCLQEHAQSAHHQHVDPEDARGQRTVDESAVYDEIYVPQTVAQYRHAYGRGKCAYGQDEESPKSALYELRGSHSYHEEQGGGESHEYTGACDPLELLPFHSSGTPKACNQTDRRQEHCQYEHGGLRVVDVRVEKRSQRVHAEGVPRSHRCTTA
jgi:hypothetical protein